MRHCSALVLVEQRSDQMQANCRILNHFWLTYKELQQCRLFMSLKWTLVVKIKIFLTYLLWNSIFRFTNCHRNQAYLHARLGRTRSFKKFPCLSLQKRTTFIHCQRLCLCKQCSAPSLRYHSSSCSTNAFHHQYHTTDWRDPFRIFCGIFHHKGWIAAYWLGWRHSTWAVDTKWWNHIK